MKKYIAPEVDISVLNITTAIAAVSAGENEWDDRDENA